MHVATAPRGVQDSAVEFHGGIRWRDRSRMCLPTPQLELGYAIPPRNPALRCKPGGDWVGRVVVDARARGRAVGDGGRDLGASLVWFALLVPTTDALVSPDASLCVNP